MLTLQAIQAAPRALQLLRRGSSWRVLQAHDEACNLVDKGGRVLALVAQAVGPGPFSLVLAGSDEHGGYAAHLAPGQLAWRQGDALRFEGLTVRCAGADLWDAQPRWDRLRMEVDWIAQLPRLVAALRAAAPAGSLADCVEVILGRAPNAADKGGALANKALAAASQAARDLCRALAHRDLEIAQRASMRLAGLGGGLTPAGDDFLVGAMYALWASGDLHWALPACRALYDAASVRTTTLSRAWLASAAHGEAAEPWHDLQKALIGGSEMGISKSSLRLIRIGHSSGADALAGFIALLLCQSGKENRAGTPARSIIGT